jgi:GT2 family glycosyltransferase
VSPRIDRLAWLSDGVALMVGVFDDDLSNGGVTLLDGEPAEARVLAYVGPQGEAKLATLHTRTHALPGDRLGRLVVRGPEGDVGFEPQELSDATVDLQTFMRTALAVLPASSRTEVMEFLAATPPAQSPAARLPLTRSLVTVREGLRERLAPAVVGRQDPHGLAVECVLAIDEHRFFVQGWFRDVEAPVTSLRAVSPEGASIELLDRIYRFRRSDLEVVYGLRPGDPAAGTGFASCFDLPLPSTWTSGWVFELRNAAGSAVEVVAPPVISSPEDVRNMLLSDIGLERPGEESLTRDHLLPAISRLQEKNAALICIDRVVQFGQPPDDPQVTIVVPLYRHITFLEHQLAQFALDPEIARTDLVYVLDSPELARDLIALSSALVDLYRVPFRVATLTQNVGYAGANQAGASLARGRLLLLLNSDVLPEKPGWLSQMISFYDSKPGIGALGPKLVFEDDTIQHAGLFFRRPPNTTFWENDHYFKGLHRDAPPACVSRVVPAVTGACMLVDRVLFDEVGGLHGNFVRGDYEDSDFCLRLIESGCENWYVAEVALHHLEGQSYDSAIRHHASRYNAWLHTHLWGERIAELMTEFRPDAGSRQPSTKPAVRSLIRRRMRNIAPRPLPIALLDGLDLAGKRVLELDSGLGNLAREVRARGATMVDAFEREPELVYLARLAAAQEELTRVSYFTGDFRDAALEGRYDLAFLNGAQAPSPATIEQIARAVDAVVAPLAAASALKVHFPCRRAIDRVVVLARDEPTLSALVKEAK